MNNPIEQFWPKLSKEMPNLFPDPEKVKKEVAEVNSSTARMRQVRAWQKIHGKDSFPPAKERKPKGMSPRNIYLRKWRAERKAKNA